MVELARARDRHLADRVELAAGRHCRRHRRQPEQPAQAIDTRARHSRWVVDDRAQMGGLDVDPAQVAQKPARVAKKRSVERPPVAPLEKDLRDAKDDPLAGWRRRHLRPAI
jgi:hypothetical protein